jgi:S1-C subfamily serine protease
VRDIQPASPAHAAGIRVGDIVTRVDAFDINDQQSLRSRLATKGVGGAVNLTYLRNGRGYNAPLRLVSPPEGGERNSTRLEIECPLWGLTVADVSPASAEQAQVPTMSGVMITDVPQESAGLRFNKGDVIFELNGKPIANVDELQEALREADGEWRFTLSRNGRTVKRVIKG